jgi:hypothetical protein
MVRFEGRVTDEQFLSYLERLTRAIAQGGRHATVIDASVAEITPPSQRRMQANWLRTHKAALAEHTAGTAFVFNSAVFRWVLSGIFIIQPPPMPHIICKTVGEGVRWAAAQLGMEPPSKGLAWDAEETTRS